MAQQQNSNENTHLGNTPSRHPVSYPSPSQYPSPSMSGYAYPPPTGQDGSSYRASPTGSNVSLPSLILPPLRTIDGRQQPPQQQAQQPPQGGPPVMPPNLPPPMGHYQYSLPPPQPMNITSDPTQPMRYPLPPPPDGRIMSGGRHKKEIKRRTKTGCLTCRKRRIKCDEGHPACRNCQKSKRDCLGYDPIFKAQPGPTNIQPAPLAVPNMQGSPAAGAPYPPPPPGYMPPGTQPYGPPLSITANSPRSSTEPYNNDYGAAIDPALDGPGTALHGKRTRMDELCLIQGIPPPPPSYKSPLSNHQLDDIRAAYARVYAPAIDKFFETRWYQLRGQNHLLNDPRLCEMFATLLLRLNIDPTHHAYYNEKTATQSLEATIIWAIMGLARLVANNPNPSNGQINYLEINDGVQEAAKRFEIFETLLLGQHLDAKPEPEAKLERNGNAVPDQLTLREKEFWRHVHTFLALHDDEASSAKEIDDTLASCRALLDSRENRDVIYSIIIARHIGQRLAEFPNNLQQPTTNDEADNKNKLHVAKSFLETQQARGTTQVVQRVCNMVVRSWALPR